MHGRTPLARHIRERHVGYGMLRRQTSRLLFPAFRIPELSRRWQRQHSGLHRKSGLLDRRNPHPHRQVQPCLGVDDVIRRVRDRLGCCARASRVSEDEDGYQGHGIHVASLRQIGRRVGRAVRRRKTLFLD